MNVKGIAAGAPTKVRNDAPAAVPTESAAEPRQPGDHFELAEEQSGLDALLTPERANQAETVPADEPSELEPREASDESADFPSRFDDALRRG